MENITNEQIVNVLQTTSFLKKRCINIANIIDSVYTEYTYSEKFDDDDLSKFELVEQIDKKIEIYENMFLDNSDLKPYIYICFEIDEGCSGNYDFIYYCFNIPLRYINESDDEIRKEISFLKQDKIERERLEKIEKEKKEAIQKAEKKEKDRIAYEEKIKTEYEKIYGKEKNATS